MNDHNVAKVLYVACSSHSGSTLLSFLLNDHPEIFTIGHLMGWKFAEDEDFYCSCGALIADCPFFARVATTFAAQGLPFEFNNFGTRYRAVSNRRINSYLTAALPFLNSSPLEKMRDVFVQRIGPFSSRLARQDRANETLIKAGIEYAKAKIFVENSHSPYRLRQLTRIKGLDIRTVHLVRDFRGVSLSNMTRRGWSPELAAKQWAGEQSRITRILPEIGDYMTVYYEELCADTDQVLARIHRFTGIEPARFSGDFKESEHHILGNRMRLGFSRISTDQRWHSELSNDQREIIERTVLSGLNKGDEGPLAQIVSHYLASPSVCD